MKKDSLLRTHTYWFTLYCTVELHLSGNEPKKDKTKQNKKDNKLLMVSCNFLLLLHTQTDWQSDVS